MIVESVMSFKHTFSEAVSKLILHETWLRNAENASPLALVTMTALLKQSRKCLYCGMPVYIARDCRKKKADKEKHDSRNGRKCFKCANARNIAKNCPKKNNIDEKACGQV